MNVKIARYHIFNTASINVNARGNVLMYFEKMKRNHVFFMLWALYLTEQTTMNQLPTDEQLKIKKMNWNNFSIHFKFPPLRH